MEKDPALKRAIAEHMEKARVAMLLRQVRQREHLTQLQLAQRAGVSQSVIARIEGNGASTLPRLDLLTRVVGAAGYHTALRAAKGRSVVEVTLA